MISPPDMGAKYC